MSQTNYLQVAVGVIRNAQGRILISQRAESLPLGGLWEFPGGKFEPGETAEQALCRELEEELGIVMLAVQPLITVKHHYPDVSVQLHVFWVHAFAGEVASTLGQTCLWVLPEELAQYPFPAANQAIVTAVRLPPLYAILDDTRDDLILPQLERLLAKGIKLIQARFKSLPVEIAKPLIAHIHQRCQQEGAWLLINSDVEEADGMACDGVHLTRKALLACQQRPETSGWVAASCHNPKELRHAQTIGVDFVVLSPVQVTLSHPKAVPLTWQVFAQYVDEVNIPVYALGGLTAVHLATARELGGQGVASIRGLLQTAPIKSL
ncbi:Nudix family hydrolase [Methylosoma difficile]